MKVKYIKVSVSVTVDTVMFLAPPEAKEVFANVKAVSGLSAAAINVADAATSSLIVITLTSDLIAI